MVGRFLPFLGAAPVGCILVDDWSFAVQLNEMIDFVHLAFDSVVDGVHSLHDSIVGTAKADDFADGFVAKEELGDLAVAVERLAGEID